MDALQDQLLSAYAAWKPTVAISEGDARELSPPLLISVPNSYHQVEQRIFFLGQETYGWGWHAEYRSEYPKYDKDFPFNDVHTFADFLANDDAVEALCWGYREFDFASRQPLAWRAPFWRAYREAQEWPGAGVVWGNLSRCDFRSGSILAAPAALVDELADMQANLLAEEIRILQPHACLFFSGPYYDALLSTVFPDVKYESVGDVSVRKLARLSHPALPERSFRTYHPASLSRQKLWSFIEDLRHLISE